MKGKEIMETNKYSVESKKLWDCAILKNLDENIAVSGEGWVITSTDVKLVSKFSGYPEGESFRTGAVIGKIIDNKVCQLTREDISLLHQRYINSNQNVLFSDVADNYSHKKALEEFLYNVSNIPDFSE